MSDAFLASMLACASPATAQSTGEIWGGLTIDWLASERLVYTLDVEPKVQVTTVTNQSRFAKLRSGRASTSRCPVGSTLMASSWRPSQTKRTARTPPKSSSDWA